MAIKKSELYSSLWASCDELRGGMDASEYKDYVLIMLFIKYISDKYAGVRYAAITVPKGASFKDMVALKGKSTIGDDINKKIIGPLEQANKSLGSIKVDFDNPEKLGTCNEEAKRIWLNFELIKKPVQCIEYIVVHEMVHFKERNHNDKFVAYMNHFLPDWKQLKSDLNKLPVSHVDWGY